MKKQYWLQIPINLHDKLMNIKKEDWINLSMNISKAIRNYKFNKNHLKKKFDMNWSKRAVVKIDFDKYKEIYAKKLEYWINIWDILLYAIDEFIK